MNFRCALFSALVFCAVFGKAFMRCEARIMCPAGCVVQENEIRVSEQANLFCHVSDKTRILPRGFLKLE